MLLILPEAGSKMGHKYVAAGGFAGKGEAHGQEFFLLYNEIVYHIHTCEDMDDLKRSILAQVKLLIPCAYASLMEVEIDPNTREILHRNPSACRNPFASWRSFGSSRTTRTRACG